MKFQLSPDYHDLNPVHLPPPGKGDHSQQRTPGSNGFYTRRRTKKDGRSVRDYGEKKPRKGRKQLMCAIMKSCISMDGVDISNNQGSHQDEPFFLCTTHISSNAGVFPTVCFHRWPRIFVASGSNFTSALPLWSLPALPDLGFRERPTIR